MIVTNWSRYPNFAKHEFDCKHTGQNRMQSEFMERLQELRIAYGRPMIISSGYRHETHPIEARKAQAGAHSTGRACDVAVMGGDALRLVALAVEHGFSGIGVQQKGSGRFIHLDDLTHELGAARPWIWSY